MRKRNHSIYAKFKTTANAAEKQRRQVICSSGNLYLFSVHRLQSAIITLYMLVIVCNEVDLLVNFIGAASICILADKMSDKLVDLNVHGTW